MSLPVVQTTPELMDVSALRVPCTDLHPVQNGPEDAKRIVSALFASLYGTPSGIGLAAPQIGILRRIAVIDVAYRQKGKARPIVLINPTLEPLSHETIVGRESCLSLPGYSGEVKRFAKVRVTTLDMQLQARSIDASGFLATVMQHEIDHLDGLLFANRVENRVTFRPSETFVERLAAISVAEVESESAQIFHDHEG